MVLGEETTTRAPATGLGAIWLDPPEWGVWPHADFPDSAFIDGRWYDRARLAAPYSNVVAQYRERRRLNARHLMVHPDWTWSITHLDEGNPDRGEIPRHVQKDILDPRFLREKVLPGAVAIAAGAGLGILLGTVIEALAEPRKRSRGRS